uniref:Uncharacterized protein n=1 Tax=Arundo donax TaxID=35708 RepID=A0A0A9AI66_ARUDO
MLISIISGCFQCWVLILTAGMIYLR